MIIIYLTGNYANHCWLYLSRFRGLEHIGLSVTLDKPLEGFTWLRLLCAHLPPDLKSFYIGIRGLRRTTLSGLDWTTVGNGLRCLPLTRLVIAKDAETCMISGWGYGEEEGITAKLALKDIQPGTSNILFYNVKLLTSILRVHC